MGMIYGKRSSSTDEANTIIQFHGYEISIAMDDRSRGGNTPLTRTSLIVTKDGEEVTYQFVGERNTDNGAINDPEGWELYAVMRRIEAKTNPQKLFHFSRKDVRENGKIVYTELGVVTASSIELAMDELGLPEVMVSKPPASHIEWAVLHDGTSQEYHLEEMHAWDNKTDRMDAHRVEPQSATK